MESEAEQYSTEIQNRTFCGRIDHPAVEGYIRRYVNGSDENLNDFDFKEGKFIRHTLADYVIGSVNPSKNKFILYSGAQSGKTTELRNLCHELQVSGEFLPVSLEVRSHSDLSLRDLPACNSFAGKEIVVAIDALDEINGEKRGHLLETISAYASEHPEIKLVLSCRSNYRREDFCNDYYELTLLDLDRADAYKYIVSATGNDTLFHTIINNGLEELLNTPFFLKNTIDAYKENKAILKNKSDLYEYFLRKEYELEKKKVQRGNQIPFADLKRILTRTALAMSLMNRQILSIQEFEECIGNNIDREKIIRYDNILGFNKESEEFFFVQNAFREWLVAQYLFEKGLPEVKRLASTPAGKVRPDWHNILSIWLSMFGTGDRNALRDITEWLNTSCLELITHVDKDCIDTLAREHVFKGIVLEYKSLGIRIGGMWDSTYRKMIEFAYSAEIARFIADELNFEEPGSSYFCDLMALLYRLPWNRLQRENPDTFYYVLNICDSAVKKSLKREPDGELALLFMDNSFFAKPEYVARYYNIIAGTTNYDALKSIFRLIAYSDTTDSYVDFILDSEKYIHNQHTGRGTLVVSRSEIYLALSKARTPNSIVKILNHDFRPIVMYDNELNDYGNMLICLLTHMQSYVTEDDTNAIEALQNCFMSIFGDRFTTSGYESHRSNLISHFRKTFCFCNRTEKYRKDFETIISEPLTKSVAQGFQKRDDAIALSGLWATPELINDYKKDLEASKPFIRALRKSPCAEVAFAAEDVLLQYSEEPEGIQILRKQNESEFAVLRNYSGFANEIRHSAERLTSADRHDWHHFYIGNLDDRMNPHVIHFVSQNCNFDRQPRKEDIMPLAEERHLYEAYFMQVVSNNLDAAYITTEDRQRCIGTAKDIVISIANGNENPYHDTAVKFMLKEKFDVDCNTLVGLLPYGNISISNPESDGFNTHTSLFSFIRENVDEHTLACETVRLLKSGTKLDSSVYNTELIDFLATSDYEPGLDYILDGISKIPQYFGNAMATLVKEGKRLDELKGMAQHMSIETKVELFADFKRFDQPTDWFIDSLEKEFPEYEGYPKLHALQLLTSLGNLKALEYLTNDLPNSIPDELRLNDFRFEYSRPEAVNWLLKILKYIIDGKFDEPFLNSSIYNSLIRIAIQNETNFNLVKDGLNQLICQGKQYRFLNYYLVQIDEKYWEGTPVSTNIHSVLQLIDEQIQEETKDKCDNPVYISYNWENPSDNAVNHLASVLTNLYHIDYKRDKNDVHYKDNIRDFMDALRNGRYVIVFLSKAYLKSPNCMYEFIGVLAHNDYLDHLYPVIVDTSIRKDEFYIELLKHWNGLISEKKSKIDEVSHFGNSYTKPLQEELDEYNEIMSKLPGIREILKWINIPSYDELSGQQFLPLIETIKGRRNLRP